jgi:predicted tellurium resistance membrane protein TerC
MMCAATPRATVSHNTPPLVLLAVGLLLMIGTLLVADAFGVHVPQGYIYCSMAFSMLVELLNMRARRVQKNRAATQSAPSAH